MKNENRLLLMIFIACMAMAVWSITSMVNADQMVHKFKSPSFSGVGTSAHYLTIENQEKTRKDAIKEKRAADEEKRLAALKNTNYAKFIKNLESRIYARFSKEMEDALFGALYSSAQSAKCSIFAYKPTRRAVPHSKNGSQISKLLKRT